MATRQTVRYRSFKEAYESHKSVRSVFFEDPFYLALLEVLGEAAAREADGVKVDPSTVFFEAVCRFEKRMLAEALKDMPETTLEDAGKVSP